MDWLENAQDSAHIIIVNAGGCQRTDNCGRRTSHQQPNIAYQCTVPHFYIFGEYGDRAGKIYVPNRLWPFGRIFRGYFYFLGWLSWLAESRLQAWHSYADYCCDELGLGTIYIKKLQIENRNLFLNLFYQFAFAGIIQLAFAFSSAKTIDVSTWSLESIAAILYLAIFGSVVAFFSYHYLLKTLLPTQVSMLSYVNTVISIVLSWLILNETISAKFIIAAVFIISGVFIINYKPGILKKRMRKREI